MSKTTQKLPLPRVLFNTQIPSRRAKFAGGLCAITNHPQFTGCGPTRPTPKFHFQGFAKICGGHARPSVPIPKNPVSNLMRKLNTLKGNNTLSGLIPGLGKKKR